VETENLRQTRSLLAGSGFLSQHSKELVFGLGSATRILRLAVEWPSGERQEFSGLPVNHRVRIYEGRGEFETRPFNPVEVPATPVANPGRPASAPATGTWLYQTFPAPGFALSDSAGRTHRLAEYGGRPVVLLFWSPACPESHAAHEQLQQSSAEVWAAGGTLLSVAVVDPSKSRRPVALSAEMESGLPVVVGDERTVGLYNLVSKYLFDRNVDMRLPVTFLIDARGEIAKVYRGGLELKTVLFDLRRLDRSPENRLQRSIPFPGEFYAAPPGRNFFQFGIYFSEKGFDAPAIAAFEETVRVSPNFAKAHYNLGTLHLRAGNVEGGRASLERAVELEPDYAEAHNNLGALAAQAGQLESALRHFQRALQAQPDIPDALNNLGYLYLQLGRPREAEPLLMRALDLDPRHPETHNNLGILFGQQGNLERARTHFERALAERPGYAEAASNLALVFVGLGRQEEGEELLRRTIEAHPEFEPAFLALARLQVNTGRRQEAEKVLEALMARKPGHREAKKLLKELRDK
jgi:Tfp pilus assembly protein PilF/peroxiredoxin